MELAKRFSKAAGRSGIPELTLVLAAAVVAYASSLNGYFHGDDFIAFVDMATKPWDDHLWDVLRFQDNNFYWRPLGQTYYRLIYETAGLQAWVFRTANLAVFLVTLVLLHRLCLTMGLSRAAAFGAVLLFALYPNHVVSVSWITNAPRLIALMFFLLSLLALHSAIEKRSLLLEGAAWLCIVLACLSDEVTIAMAPIPVVYAFFVHREYRSPLRLGMRVVAYGAIVAALLPLQFLFTPDDEPRLAFYGFSWNIPEQAWSLASQLALPLTDANPMDVPEVLMSDQQWAAGAALLVVLGLGILFGSARVRFLALWVIAALAPFSLWNIEVVAPRYVYLAGAPLAILVAVLASAIVEQLPVRPLRFGAGGVAAIALVVVSVIGLNQTEDRNGQWERATDDYRVLAEGLQSVHEDLPSGSRVVVMDGPWLPYWRWPVAAVQTIYHDPTLSAVSVPPGWPYEALPGDVVVYHSEGRLHLTKVR
jgi:hypothetical protein